MLRFRDRLRLIAFSDTSGTELLGAAVLVWVGYLLTAPEPSIFDTSHAWHGMASILQEQAWGLIFCVVGGYVWTARLLGSTYMRAVGLGSGAGLCLLTALLQARAGVYVGPGVWAIMATSMIWSAFVLLRRG